MRERFMGNDCILDHGKVYWVTKEYRENGEIWAHIHDAMAMRLVRTVQYLGEEEYRMWWKPEGGPRYSPRSVELKPVTPCLGCSSCAEFTETGFTGSTRYFCTRFSDGSDQMEVEAGDGCTFGSPGERTKAATQYDVALGGDAAVNGYSGQLDDGRQIK